MSKLKEQWILSKRIDKVTRRNLKDLPGVVAQLLFNRAIHSKEEADAFFNPTQDQILPPKGLSDITKASKRITEAINKNEKICIYGDFDVDGIVATVILWEYLYKTRGVSATPYIPHREKEGYSLNEEAVTRLREEGHTVIITVDCGIRDVEIVKKFKSDIDFIIVDHHHPGNLLPNAHSIVHPNISRSSYSFRSPSGATVVWKLIAALEGHTEAVPDWSKITGSDLVCMSTICDVMPLIQENRSIVSLGLGLVKKSSRLGLKELFSVSNFNSEIVTSTDIAFKIGPRLNALGRLDHALEGVRLLLTNNKTKSFALAEKANVLNSKRKEIVDTILDQVFTQSDLKIDSLSSLIIKGKDWPGGVLGLVAGKLTEKYHRPSIVLSKQGRLLKGSARSIEGFDLVNALEKLSHNLISYGGHAGAAGLSLLEKDFFNFQEEMLKITDQIPKENIGKKIITDAVLEVTEANMKLLDYLDMFQPFGFGNPEPVFQFIGYIKDGTKVGSDGAHYKCTFFDSTGEIDTIGFGMAEDFSLIDVTKQVHMLGRLERNSFNGTSSPQIKIISIKQ